MAGDGIELNGIVEELCKGGVFRVRIKIPQAAGGEIEHVILARPSGKIRKHNINIVLGDSVKVEVSPYALDKGRIVFRNK